jgi:hypothetical protein
MVTQTSAGSPWIQAGIVSWGIGKKIFFPCSILKLIEDILTFI